MAQNIARLGVVLGIDTAEFTKGIEAAKKSVSDLANKIPQVAAVATAAFAAMTYKALQFSDQMADLSDATGVGIAKILQIGDALNQSGGQADNAGKILVKFNQTIDDAAQGSQKAQDAFTRIGISLNDLKKLSPEELLVKTSDAISKLGDKASQTGAAINLFGKGIKGVDMDTFSKQIQDNADEYQKFAYAVAQAAELHDKLAKKAYETNLIFTEKLLPSLNAIFDAINTKGGAAEFVFEKLRWLVTNLWLGVEGLVAGFRTLGVSFDAALGRISKDDAWKAMVNIENHLNSVIAKVQELNKASEKGLVAPKPLGGGVPDVKDSPEALRIKQMLEMAKLLSVEYERQQKFSLQQLGVRNAMVGMTNDERKIQESVNQVLDSTSRKIDDITKRREEAVGRGTDQKVIDEYDRQIEAIERMKFAFVNSAKEMTQASIDAQRTFEFGWDKAFNQFAENAYNYGKVAEDIFNSLTSSMSQAIDNFVQTGKLSFADLTKSIIQNIIRIQLQMQASQLFSQAGGLLRGLFNSSIGGTGFGVEGMSESAVLAGRTATPLAEGGFAEAGRLHLVGEQGPELFIPRTSGTIISNDNLSGALNQPQVVYNGPYIANMQAIDTQSATQFLAKNKMAVWSANQSANRSMPASR